MLYVFLSPTGVRAAVGASAFTANHGMATFEVAALCGVEYNQVRLRYVDDNIPLDGEIPKDAVALGHDYEPVPAHGLAFAEIKGNIDPDARGADVLVSRLVRGLPLGLHFNDVAAPIAGPVSAEG